MSRFRARMAAFLVAGMLALAPGVAMANAFDNPQARTSGSAGSGDLVPTQSNVPGGQISIGATAQVVVLFRNDSGRPLTVGEIQLYPSSTVSASVALNQCSQEPLEAGAVCAVSVQVKGLSSGNWRVEMLMRHSGRARIVTATMSGQIDASADASKNFVSDVEAIPGEIDFETISTSQPVVKGIVLRNITSEPIDISAVYIEAAQQAGFGLRTDCTTLTPGQACIVTVTWSPVLEGEVSGVLLVEHSGATSIASVPLEGEFNPTDTKKAEIFPKAVPGKGLIVASQNEVNFGTGIATTSAITVSLVNVGDSAVRISELRLANGDNGLTIARSGCAVDMILEPIEACPLTISWAPVRQGNIIDDVQVKHDGARGVLVLPVRGASTAVISQDNQAVRLVSGDFGSVIANDNFVRNDDVDPPSVLDGFKVTSHSPTRAIITGPGGSRIVFNNDEVVIGGFLWKVLIRSSGVEFQSGNDKVLLLFDRSLSSVNRVSGQSGRSSSSGTSAASTSSSTPAMAAP